MGRKILILVEVRCVFELNVDDVQLFKAVKLVNGADR